MGNRRFVLLPSLLIAGIASTSCASPGTEVSLESYGAQPKLPVPQSSVVPTVSIAAAKGWPSDQMPTAMQGYMVQPFARGLSHPRTLHVLPNGDVLVAETNAPAKEKATAGFRDWAMKMVMKFAGAGVVSPDRILLLRDTDGDGVAELKTIFLDHLHSPFGIALVGNTLYVANTDAIVQYPYIEGQTEITVPAVNVMTLPSLPINHHWTKDLIASPDGSKLYVTVGSNSNIAENGVDNEHGRAAIWEFDRALGKSRIFANGLRNPNGLAWNPQTGALWVAVNERDELGNDLVPDYITSVKDGGFYGWPYSYFGQNLDLRVTPQRPDLVAKALKPDYAVGAHTAPLGMTFYNACLWPHQFLHGAFVSQHGSWNRKPFSGYKVIFVPFDGGKPSGLPINVLTGFLSPQGAAYGRPVGLAIDRRGALLVADDVGNAIWRVLHSMPEKSATK